MLPSAAPKMVTAIIFLVMLLNISGKIASTLLVLESTIDLSLAFFIIDICYHEDSYSHNKMSIV